MEDQCTGQVLRIGQARPVYVALPNAVLDANRRSFDCNFDALIHRQRQVFQDAFMPSEPTADDRDELFRTTVGQVHDAKRATVEAIVRFCLVASR